ncbi:MAG: glutamate synthase subunit beta [Candidatus Margulisiibacteriota bacterium]
MGNPQGFLKVKREKTEYRPVCERVKDYAPVARPRADEQTREQASRCMDCGTPFCHWGCPLGNYIPEWNDLAYNFHWRRAIDLLEATNNLPEVTGRVCPAICEFACVLGINDDPVTIRENELAIVEHGFRHGLIKPKPPEKRTGKRVAVVGSGPAGLACAAQLNKAGHLVTVCERADQPGGLMRYGIPEFKLEKSILDRRLDLWRQEGIEFRCGVNVGVDIGVDQLAKEYDAVVLAGGSRVPRDLKVPGRELAGIHFALEYLIKPNNIDAKGKKVVVIGGGDTGADCVGLANRQGAACVVQIELLPEPPKNRPAHQPWPKYPAIFKTSTSHEEGCERRWSVTTEQFLGRDSRVTGLRTAAGTEIEADLVLLALGFLHPEPVPGLAIALDQRGNFQTDANYQTSRKGFFAAGDARRGQSLIVWALAEGRRAARAVDEYLMGESRLPLI